MPTVGAGDTFTLTGSSELRIRRQLVDEDWTTGCMSTVNSVNQGFTFRRGYAECRAKLPAGDKGGWFAFWGTSELTYPPGTPNSERRGHAEIDFIEAYTDEMPGRAHYTAFIHNRGNPIPGGTTGDVQTPSHTPLASVADDTYHLFGVEITDQWIIKYLDRVEISRLPLFNEVRLGGIHLLIDWAGNDDAAGPWASPSDVYIDYVKVWQKP